MTDEGLSWTWVFGFMSGTAVAAVMNYFGSLSSSEFTIGSLLLFTPIVGYIAYKETRGEDDEQ